MSFWTNWFSDGSVTNKQLPSTMVAKEFGEVNVKKGSKETEVTFTILMEPVDEEGWQTGVAIDGSGSMQPAFGHSNFGNGIEPVPGKDIPAAVLVGYQKKGWLQWINNNGQSVPLLSEEAKQDLIRQRYCRISTNSIEPIAREMTAYLAGNLDADGGTTVIYWACGERGDLIEVIGDLSAEDCKTASFQGPSKYGFGGATRLQPAVEYFAERFKDAPNGIYLFITDGALNDLKEVKKYTISLCKEIESKRRNPLKCVLIGMGPEIDEKQMEELDDLDSGTSVDLWDHKIAKEMRSLTEIFAEVVSENTIVAPHARILDSKGRLVMKFDDGLPAKVTFTMPSTSDGFVLDIGVAKIEQSVVYKR